MTGRPSLVSLSSVRDWLIEKPVASIVGTACDSNDCVYARASLALVPGIRFVEVYCLKELDTESYETPAEESEYWIIYYSSSGQLKHHYAATADIWEFLFDIDTFKKSGSVTREEALAIIQNIYDRHMQDEYPLRKRGNRGKAN
jgi:hypothetical protein